MIKKKGSLHPFFRLNAQWRDRLLQNGSKVFEQGGPEAEEERLRRDNLRQVFTTFNNPKGNADTERVFRTLKEDLIWPSDWFSFQQLHLALARWFSDYNHDFPHSSLKYLTPVQYESIHQQSLTASP